MNPSSFANRFGLCRSLVILFVCLGSTISTRGETLPGGVSDIIRELGELRDISWGLLEEARKAYATNEAKLNGLNVRYIEASAAANSLIEQFQLETVARTSMEPRRYKSTLDRVRTRCGGFTNEWTKLMTPEVRTRGETATVQAADAQVQLASKAVTIADSFLNLISRNRKAFRELDSQQRLDVRNLLEERKWRTLDGASAKPAEAKTPVPKTADSTEGRAARSRPGNTGNE